MRKKALVAIITILLPAIVVGAERNAEQQAMPQLIVIADFKGPDYGQWKTTGTAFGNGPTDGAASSASGGDDAIGTLTSPEFTIKRGYINFRIQGGNFPDDIRIQLIVDGKAVRKTSGNHRKDPFWLSWDVLDLKGRSARIVVSDDSETSTFSLRPGREPVPSFRSASIASWRWQKLSPRLPSRPGMTSIASTCGQARVWLKSELRIAGKYRSTRIRARSCRWPFAARI